MENNELVTREAANSPHSESKEKSFLYGLNENPPWTECIWLGLQHCLLSATAIAVVPLLIGKQMCMFDDDIGIVARTEWAGSLFFLTGIVTILQCTLGTRLPIFQGTTYTIFAPIFAVLSLSHNLCPEPIQQLGQNGSIELFYNDSDGQIVDGVELWQRRMREIQGSLAVASVLEVIIGLSGATTFLMRYIGPLTIGPAVALIGLDLCAMTIDHASTNWAVSALTVALLTLFSQYLNEIHIPVPTFKKKFSFRKKRTNFTGMFSVLISALVGWALCYILTITGALSSDSEARTDKATSNSLALAPWFYVPYPGHQGLPTVSVSGLVAMIAAVFAGLAESIGDYHACANIVNAPPPPPHVVARGITIEGIGCVLAGLMSASGSTSFSNNLAATAITRVASRRVMVVAGVLMTIFGVFTKFGAIFIMIPTPVLGGLFLATFGMICAIGFSTLQHVDMTNGRNQYIVGISLFVGLVVSRWMKANPEAVNTGVDVIDDTLTVILKTAILVGGVCAAFLDNTIPGTLEERGMIAWKKGKTRRFGSSILDESCYDVPLPRFKFMEYVPIFAEYDKRIRTQSKREEDSSNEQSPKYQNDVL